MDKRMGIDRRRVVFASIAITSNQSPGIKQPGINQPVTKSIFPRRRRTCRWACYSGAKGWAAGEQAGPGAAISQAIKGRMAPDAVRCWPSFGLQAYKPISL